MGDVRVRVATGERELRDVGALTAEAYHADRLLRPEDDYTVELRDAERRAQEAVLLVALVPAAPPSGPRPVHDAPAGGHGGVGDGAGGVGAGGPGGGAGGPGGGGAGRGEGRSEADARDRGAACGTGARDEDELRGVVVGTVTLAPSGTSYAEVAEAGEAEIRMLAVAPEARRRGVAEALMRSALDHAVTSGHRRVVLSTFDAMQSAQRLYRRLGFVPAPGRDWHHEGVRVRVHVWDAPQAPGVEVETATWRPVDTVDVGPWRLGFSGGFTRRANSVVALGEPVDVDAAIAEAERRYADAGLPAVFRVCDGSRPADLASRLAGRGYATVSRTSVLVRDVEPRDDEPRDDDLRYGDAVDGDAVDGDAADGAPDGAAPDTGDLDVAASDAGPRTGTADDLSRSAAAGDATRDAGVGGHGGPSRAPSDDGLRITIADSPDDDWLQGWLAVKANGGVDLDLARRVVSGAPARYATASDDHGVVGVIRAARAGEWVGLSCLMVAERARRRGLGRRLTDLTLRDAAERGATRAFLQVEEHNVGARALYLGAGFQAAEVYEYRERGSVAGEAPTGGC